MAKATKSLTPATAMAASRMPFVTASALTSVLAVAWCWTRGTEFNPFGAVLAVLGTVFVHLGANTINDYYDWDDCDRDNPHAGPFSGGSRHRMEGLVERRHFLWLSVAWLSLAGLAAVGLVVIGRPWVLAVGGLGALLGILYSSPPFRLSARGFGEATIFLAFGPLVAWGTGYAVEGVFRLEHFLVGIPLGLLVANILWINEFPDFEADQRAGKRTLVVRMGLHHARGVYPVLLGSSILSVAVLGAMGLFPWWSLCVGLILPVALPPVKRLWSDYGDPAKLLPAQAATIQVHVLGGVLLVLSLVVPALF